MKLNNRNLVCIVMISLLAGAAAAGDPGVDDLPKVRSPYLGQEPPGNEPRVFAKGFISTAANEHGCSFSPDGEEFYFTRILDGTPAIMTTRLSDSGWTEPAVTAFSGRFNDRLPSVSPDGSRLFFESIRPWPDSSGQPAHHAWFVRRTDTGWGPAQPLQLPLHRNTTGVSVSSRGTLFTGGITRMEQTNGQYLDSHSLDPQLKGDYPFIAPDESYLLFCAGRQRDLVVSFHCEDDSWTAPIRIIEGQPAYWVQGFPIVSPCGKYLFFTANHDIYWMDAGVLGELRPPKSDN